MVLGKNLSIIVYRHELCCTYSFFQLLCSIPTLEKHPTKRCSNNTLPMFARWQILPEIHDTGRSSKAFPPYARQSKEDSLFYYGIIRISLNQWIESDTYDFLPCLPVVLSPTYPYRTLELPSQAERCVHLGKISLDQRGQPESCYSRW